MSSDYLIGLSSPSYLLFLERQICYPVGDSAYLSREDVARQSRLNLHSCGLLITEFQRQKVAVGGYPTLPLNFREASGGKIKGR